MSAKYTLSDKEQISLRSGASPGSYQNSDSMSETYEERDDVKPETRSEKLTKWRNILGFWILGLCNNFPYVIMLSAAFDIIHQLDTPGGSPNPANQSNETIGSCDLLFNSTTNMSAYLGREKCERQGTSTILLADILPTFIIKLVAPYFMNFLPYWFRVIIAVISSALSFILVALSINEPLVIFGVALASIASGFGEITFLSMTARYHKSTVTAWSSGTGAAGVGGSLVYAGLKTFLSPKVTLLIQLVVPVAMILAYLFILGKPGSIVPEEESGSVQRSNEADNGEVGAEQDEYISDDKDSQALLGTPPPESHTPTHKKRSLFRFKGLNKKESLYWLAHIKYIPRLWKYMLPLFAVYAAEYMINQGFFELLYNENTHIGGLCLDQHAQYRWLQVIYQVGVFLSRSSVSVYHFKHYWILSILQVINFVFFFCATWYLFIPSFWLTFFLVLYEGLLGGGVYVNAFYAISIEVPKVHREFSMGVASVADSTGITVAGVSAHFIHTFICNRIGYQ